nr:gliding motility-associated C-terminal domain-containing protein [bacterium]
SGMDLKKTKILLKEETGKIVPGILNFYDVNKETTNLNEYTTIEINEYTTIEWTVNDVQALKPGVYKVEVEATDMAQNIAKEEITFGFSPAPQFKPEILSIKPQNEKRFNTPISQVIVVVKDNSGTGINFENSTIRVTGPGVSTEDYQSDDGVDMLFWNFANPLATDHSDDGEYVVTVKVVDYASNSTETEITFIYDTVPPQVKTGSVPQVSPAPGSVINTADLRKISVTLEDPSGIDLDKSTIQLNGPKGAVDGQETDNGIDTLIFEFAPLKKDGSDDGEYTIIVTPADKVGNVAKFPLEFTFIYDTSPPLIRALVPTTDSSVVSPIDAVSATLDDGEGSGVDLVGSSVRLIRLADPPQIIGGEQSDNGVDIITLSFARLVADGSENGIYHIKVMPQDNLGNTPESPIIFEFTYTVTAPLLISTTPEANAVLNIPIDGVTAVLQDRSGKGMDFSKSDLTLSRLHTLKPPSGVEVSGTLTYTQDTLVFTLSRLLATDGRDDGNYLISVTAADLAESQATYSVPFIYDTLPPVVSEVKPTPNEAIKESISQVSAKLSDSGAGVDLAKSSITLKGPKGAVSGRQTNDGIDTIKWEFSPLASRQSDDGMYTITVTPVDKIGNKTIIPLEFTFIYDTTPPDIIELNPAAHSTVVSPIDKASATLDDGDGSGLDISTSTIKVSRVVGETVQAVEGEQHNGVDTLVFSFANPLSADGSDNGIYRIEVMPQDKLGNTPESPIIFEFTYNVSAPLLVSTTPAVGSALNAPIEQVTAVLQDRSGRGLDDDLSNLTLKRGEIEVPGSLTNVVASPSVATLIFTLSSLFATDGTDDGDYIIQVTAVDLAGSEATYSVPFIYDTLPPVVSEVKPTPNEAIKESISEVSAKLSDSGAGIDLSNSSITLKGPKVAVSGRQTNDGIDTIKWEFSPLASRQKDNPLPPFVKGEDDGMYTITVTPVDKIGNKTIIPLEFTFIYDTTPPDIIELNPAAHSTVVSPIDKASATLDDGDGSGLDISTSTIKVSRVVGETVQAVEGEQHNGVDTLVFSFANPLSADGSDNGIYRIEVMPQDKLGNTPESPIIFEFTYNVSAPLLVSTTPAVGSALNAPIEQVTAVLQDRSGRGLDNDLSNLTLKRGENEVPGSLTNVVASPSVATLIFTLSRLFATDGTDDGDYTIQVTAVDLAGSKVSYSVSFTYDTQPPYVSDANPKPNKVTNESISFVSAKLVDEYTGVDLEKSSITLKAPKGVVSGHQTNDGIDTIKWEFTSLGADGIYTIEVVPVDKLGNKAFAPSPFKFNFDTNPPTVSTEPGADAFLTTPISNVSAILDDGIGSGVDLSASRITVSDPSGLIEGTQVNNGINTIIFQFDSPLATDGSADGDYTIEVITQDILSNVSDQLKFGFEYRPRVPVLVETAPENKAKFNTPIDVVSAVLSDQTDSGLNLAETSITVAGPGVLPEDTTGHNSVDTMFWTFTNPLATDGTDDGEYTVTVTAVTRSGLSVTSKSTFIYDTTAPVVTEITPPDGDILTTSISEVTATLSDAVSLERIGGFDTLRTQPKGFAGVDLDKSTIQLQGPVGSVRGRQTNNGVDTIRLEFAPFVAAEGRRYDGEYTIQVKPRDMLGNSIPISQNFKFKFDTTPPTVVSTAPEDKTIVVSPINRISATLDDANGAGVDLEKSTVRLIGPNGLVKGSISSDGINTIFWDFDAFLASDGTDDGMYTITVTPVDKKNNAAKTVRSSPTPGAFAGLTALRFGFTYTTKAPGIVSTNPPDEAFLNTTLNSISAVLKDNSGEGLNWEGTTIAITGPDDQLVSSIVDKDDISNTITLTFDSLLAIDGSDDGRYTMTIVAADNTGVKVEYTREFTYDTIPSSVSKASVLLEDGEVSVDLVVDSTKRLNESISKVSAVLFDRGVGVNLVGSTIKLTGPKGTVSGLQTNDGVSLISLKFQPLAADGADDGLYTVTVTPKDFLGNVAVTEERFDFLYDTTPPRVVRTTPKDREGIVSPIDTVSVVLDDGGGAGIDFVNSRVSLEGPKGLIEGEQSDNELDTITLSFEPLPIDIADGGDYFIHITAPDLLGNSKSTVVSFTYKPTAPSIKELSPNDEALLNLPPAEISVTLEAQIGTEINLDGSRMQLFNPQGALELGELTHVEVEDRASTLRLKLDIPPATDGSDDGRYTIKITAMDNRGNSVIHTAEFLYDTTAPEVIWTQPENGGILKENISGISAKLKDEHAGVDLIGSTISLSGVKGKQQNNGVDTIKLQFAQLPDDGVYKMTVHPKDVLGNAPPEPITYSFRLDTTPPTVASTEPPDGAILVNTRLFQIKAALDDEGVRSSPTPGAIAGLTGSGVDLSKSTITLTGPRGKITGRKQTDSNTLIFVLSTPLTLVGADDGKYTIEVVPVDKAGNSAEPFLSSFVYDTIQPGGPKLSNISSLPVSFSPNGDGASDTTRISFALSKRAKVTVSVYNSASELARTLVDSEEMDEGENSLIWDGTSDNVEHPDEIGGDVRDRALTLPDGAYTLVFDAKDVDDLTGALESVQVSIDTQPPIISNLSVSNNPFTPDGDGFADLTSISFSVTNSTPQDSITVAIYDTQTRGIVSPRLPIEPMFEGNGNYSATWDGFDTGFDTLRTQPTASATQPKGSLAANDGEYIYEVIAKDLANNIRTISGTIMLDRNAPSIEVIEPESAFVTIDQPFLLVIGSATDFSGVRLIEALVSEISPASTSSSSIWQRVMFSGDGIDNDLDGAYDEEEYNRQDDDGDGKTDEDLRAKDSIPSSSGETHPVDYIYKFYPKSDGKYILNIRAMDNVGHTTPESDFIIVTVDYDTVPPVHLSTSVFKNGKEYAIPPKYKNGDEIKIVSKWDAAGYKVTADFSEIDSTLFGGLTPERTVSALDNGDGTYTLQHQINLDNKASEGSKTVRITAVDGALKETVIDTIVLELDNTLPEIISVRSIEPAYRNSDLITLTVMCDSANYQVRADFSSVDSTYEPVGTDLKPARTEEVTNNGDKTYTIKYQISDANTRPDAKSLPIAISVFDGVNTAIDKSFTAELDNTPPEFISISAKDKVLSNGITAVLTVTLDEPGYTLLADFSSLDSEYAEGDETLTDNRDRFFAGSGHAYTVEYTISKENTREDAKNTLIQFKAIDVAGNVKEYSFSVILDNVAPEILGVSSQDEDIIYKNGDAVNLLVQTDAAGYNVKADFSFLDSQYEPGGEETDDKGDRTYIVSYTISEGNTKGTEKVLENLPVIIAVSDERHTSSYDAFTLQLDNQPPKIEISSPSGENPVSTTAQIEIRGKTEAGSVGALSPTIKIAPASVESSYDADTGEFSFTIDLKVGETQITLQATDVAGNKTVKELLITYRPIISEIVSATKGAEIILPEEVDDRIADNDTKIIISPFALPKDVVVSITLVKDALPVPNNPEIAQDNATPLAAYRIFLKSANGKDILSVLSKPATLILQFPAEKEKTKAVPLRDVSLDIENLKLFKWDGVYWNKVGGKAQRNNTIIAKVDNISGLFAIFEIEEAPRIFKVYPPRPNPFTPNGDGVNDLVEFYFENLQGLEPIIRIYDQRGALVRELTDVGTTSATWNGKDEDGKLLELGLYIYQIKIGAKVGGGMVILAR